MRDAKVSSASIRSKPGEATTLTDRDFLEELTSVLRALTEHAGETGLGLCGDSGPCYTDARDAILRARGGETVTFARGDRSAREPRSGGRLAGGRDDVLLGTTDGGSPTFTRRTEAAARRVPDKPVLDR